METPEKIYLNFGEITKEEFEKSSFDEFADVTWCQDKVFENDVEYIRKDIVDNMLKTAEEAMREKMLKEIEHSLCCCEDEWSSDMSEEKDWLKNRLKSLRPQKHWKPTEEQMEALKQAAVETKGRRISEQLSYLYIDLKKL